MMREVKGLVHLVETLDGDKHNPISRFYLYGRAVNSRASFEDFESNGLVPYDDARQARAAMDALKKLHPANKSLPGLLKIAMKIAKNEDDLKKLKESKRVIVVYSSDMNGLPPVRLIGRSFGNEKSCAYGNIGAYLCQNGMKPFFSYQEAEKAAKQIQEMDGGKVRLATFDLRIG